MHQRKSLFRLAIALLPAAAILWPPAVSAQGVGWDSDDFLVAGFLSGSIGVFDSDFTFKGNLEASFDRVTGLDFDSLGNLVGVSQSTRSEDTSEVRVYDSSGTRLSRFVNSDLGFPIDLKVGPAKLGGNYYVGTQTDVFKEVTPSGASGRTFGNGIYMGVAILPEDVVWSGGLGLPGIEVFDLSTGIKTATLSLDNGQQGVRSMFYSSATDTVLITDTLQRSIATDRVYERESDGSFIRSFTAPGLESIRGVTRGPGGDVFATDFLDNGVYRWRADSTFVDFTPFTGDFGAPVNILWTGNSPEFIPEPATVGLLALAGMALLFFRCQR